VAIAVSPAILVLVLTLIVSLVTGHPEGLFFTRSIRGLLVRFVIVTLVLTAPILILPQLLALVGRIAKSEGLFGQLVKGAVSDRQDFSRLVAWLIRPVQGISLSLILAERFLSFLEEFSIGTSYATLLVTLTLFLMGGALTSLFLSVVWAFDDLGIKIYNKKTGEVHLAGSIIGTVLPLITGAIGVSGLFHTSLPLDAFTDLLEIVMVLYPSYVFFAFLHHEFVIKRSSALSGNFATRSIETKVW